MRLMTINGVIQVVNYLGLGSHSVLYMLCRPYNFYFMNPSPYVHPVWLLRLRVGVCAEDYPPCATIGL